LTNPDLANSATLALGVLPHPEARQVILAAFHSGNSERQLHAIHAAACSNTLEFIEPLRAIVLGSDNRLAEEAALALSKIRLRESALALIDASSRLARREICIATLARMGDCAIPALAYGLRIYELETRRAIVEALARISSTKALDVLTTALEDEQPAIRYGVLSALAHVRRVLNLPAPADGCEGEH